MSAEVIMFPQQRRSPGQSIQPPRKVKPIPIINSEQDARLHEVMDRIEAALARRGGPPHDAA